MDSQPEMSDEHFDPKAITRPDPALWTYYVLCAVASNVAFPVLIVYWYFRYHTLRYRFDDKGVSMAWGILFRREIYLTYRRIQDIHVTRNIFQRWLSLATVSVQTASGSAGAEMKIEGIRRPELLRDFLYRQMRGARGETEPQGAGEAGGETASDSDEALALLHEIRDDLRGLRQAMEARS